MAITVMLGIGPKINFNITQGIAYTAIVYNIDNGYVIDYAIGHIIEKVKMFSLN